MANASNKHQELVESQFKILEAANDMIAINVKEYHEKHCGDKSARCAENFMKIFLMLLGQRVMEESIEVLNTGDERGPDAVHM